MSGINSFYEKLSEENSKIVKIENVGKTFESRDIKLVKINSEDSKLPAIVIDAGVMKINDELLWPELVKGSTIKGHSQTQFFYNNS